MTSYSTEKMTEKNVRILTAFVAELDEMGSDDSGNSASDGVIDKKAALARYQGDSDIKAAIEAQSDFFEITAADIRAASEALTKNIDADRNGNISAIEAGEAEQFFSAARVVLIENAKSSNSR